MSFDILEEIIVIATLNQMILYLYFEYSENFSKPFDRNVEQTEKKRRKAETFLLTHFEIGKSI